MRIDIVPVFSSRSTSSSRPREEAVDELLVVLHRRALGDRERDDAGARGRHPVELEDAVDDADLDRRVLADGELLFDDLGRQARARRAQPLQLRRARGLVDVAEDDRAEAVGEDVAPVAERRVQLVRRDPGARRTPARTP